MSLKIGLGDVNYSLKIQLYEQALAEADTLLLSEPRNENLIQLLRKLHSRISFHFRTLGKFAQKEGNFESAKNWFLQSLKHSERTVYYVESNLELMTDKRWIFDAHLNYTEDLSRLGRIEEAMENLEIAGKTLQDIKKNNADDREIVIFEIWHLCVRQAILKQQGKPEAALAAAETGLNLAIERTESDPTNIEPIVWTLELANAAANLASGLKRGQQAESYRRTCRKYESQYKEKFGGDFGYVF